VEAETLCVFAFVTSSVAGHFFGVVAKKVGPPFLADQKKVPPQLTRHSELATQTFFGEGQKNCILLFVI
jgi:hypothetical protein